MFKNHWFRVGRKVDMEVIKLFFLMSGAMEMYNPPLMQLLGSSHLQMRKMQFRDSKATS